MRLNWPGLTGGGLVQWLGCLFLGLQGFVENRLCVLRRDVSDGAVQVFGVVPVDSFKGVSLDLAGRLPGAEDVDDLGSEATDDALGQGSVIGLADAADRAFGPGFGQAFGASDRQVLRWYCQRYFALSIFTRRRLLGFDPRIAVSCSCIFGSTIASLRYAESGPLPGSGRTCRPPSRSA